MENKTILEERILAVKEAGKEIQKIYQEGFSISYKEDDSPVTNADLASNQIIRNHLSKFNMRIIKLINSSLSLITMAVHHSR